MRRWRLAGLKANVYIDDGICSANSIQASVLECEAMASDLKNAGYPLNEEKSHLHGTNAGWLIAGIFSRPPRGYVSCTRGSHCEVKAITYSGATE